jgi:quercetin dioxygenase-like cupin family protein
MSIVEHSTLPWHGGSARSGSRIQFVVDPTGAVAGLSLLIQECRPGIGAASHTHDCEEVLTIDAGTAEVWVGEARQRVGPGTSIFIPRGAVHGFTNVGDSLLRLRGAITALELRTTFV